MYWIDRKSLLILGLFTLAGLLGLWVPVAQLASGQRAPLESPEGIFVPVIFAMVGFIMQQVPRSLAGLALAVIFLCLMVPNVTSHAGNLSWPAAVFMVLAMALDRFRKIPPGASYIQ